MFKSLIISSLFIIVSGCSNTIETEKLGDDAFEDAFKNHIVSEVTLPDGRVYLNQTVKQEGLSDFVLNNENGEVITLDKPDYFMQIGFPEKAPAYPVEVIKNGEKFPKDLYFLTIVSNEKETLIEFEANDCKKITSIKPTFLSDSHSGCGIDVKLLKIN